MRFASVTIKSDSKDEPIRVLRDVDVLQTGPFGDKVTATKDGEVLATLSVWDDYPIRINESNIEVSGSLTTPDSDDLDYDYGTWVLHTS